MSVLPELKPVSPETLAAFKKQRRRIVDDVVEKSMRRVDEVSQHGEQTEQLLTSGIDFTTQALEASMQLHNAEMLEYQLQWAWDRLPNDGVQHAHLVSRFKIIAQVIHSDLPSQNAQEVDPYIQWLIERQSQLIQEKEQAA